jgi:hypothetical protein
VTATKSWGPTPTETLGTEVDYQVAAPLKREHPTGTERISLTKECGWKDGDRGGPAQTQNPLVRKRKTDLTLTGLLMEGLIVWKGLSWVDPSGRMLFNSMGRIWALPFRLRSRSFSDQLMPDEWVKARPLEFKSRNSCRLHVRVGAYQDPVE